MASEVLRSDSGTTIARRPLGLSSWKHRSRNSASLGDEVSKENDCARVALVSAGRVMPNGGLETTRSNDSQRSGAYRAVGIERIASPAGRNFPSGIDDSLLNASCL